MNILENYFDVNRIPDYCSKEKLYKFYNAYLHNLHQSPYRTLWVTLDEIEGRTSTSWTCIGDKYLEDSENNVNKLAMDIYFNGTYFPIFVFKQNGEKYKIRDGIHRLSVMRQLIQKGYWNKDKKILIATDEVLDSANNECIFHIPIVVVDGFKQNYDFIYRELSKKPPKYIDSEKELVEYRTSNEGYLAFSSLSLLLRNAFFEYKELTGTPIQPSPVINNQESWKKWRGY